jgi:hypothetical protein
MATLPPVSSCSQCGAETQLLRADIPYCVDCVDRIRTRLGKGPIGSPVPQPEVDRDPGWELVLMIVAVGLAVACLFVGRG